MTVTVVGAGASARDAVAELQSQGYDVRLVEDGTAEAGRSASEDELPPDEHAATILERAALRREELDRLGVVIEARTVDVPLPIDRSRCEVITGRRVVAWTADANRRVTHLCLERADGTGAEELAVQTLVLAADTITTTRIFLESWRRATGESARLTGLQRTQGIRFCFVTPERIGRPIDAYAAGSPRIAMTLREQSAEDEIRGAIATVELERFAIDVATPALDVRTSFRLVREARAAVGSVSLQLPDRARASCFAELGPDGIAVHWQPPTGDRARQGRAVARARRALRLLGIWTLPGIVTAAEDKYAGTLPTTEEERPFTTRADGSSRDFAALYIVGDSSRRMAGRSHSADPVR